jgi:hypothetical protein
MHAASGPSREKRSSSASFSRTASHAGAALWTTWNASPAPMPCASAARRSASDTQMKALVYGASSRSRHSEGKRPDGP